MEKLKHVSVMSNRHRLLHSNQLGIDALTNVVCQFETDLIHCLLNFILKMAWHGSWSDERVDNNRIPPNLNNSTMQN